MTNITISAQVFEDMADRIEELKDRLNYAVGEREDYEKIIKQLQAEWLANRVAIMRLEAKLAKAVEALRGWIDFANAEGMPVLLSDLEAAELTGDTP